LLHGTSVGTSAARIRPGQHGQNRRRKRSDYGGSLREKQKVKRSTDRREAVPRYYHKAVQARGSRVTTLIQRCSSAGSDNVAYRMGFATITPRRAAAPPRSLHESTARRSTSLLPGEGKDVIRSASRRRRSPHQRGGSPPSRRRGVRSGSRWTTTSASPTPQCSQDVTLPIRRAAHHRALLEVSHLRASPRSGLRTPRISSGVMKAPPTKEIRTWNRPPSRRVSWPRTGAISSVPDAGDRGRSDTYRQVLLRAARAWLRYDAPASRFAASSCRRCRAPRSRTSAIEGALHESTALPGVVGT